MIVEGVQTTELRKKKLENSDNARCQTKKKRSIYDLFFITDCGQSQTPSRGLPAASAYSNAATMIQTHVFISQDFVTFLSGKIDIYVYEYGLLKHRKGVIPPPRNQPEGVALNFETFTAREGHIRTYLRTQQRAHSRCQYSSAKKTRAVMPCYRVHLQRANR